MGDELQSSLKILFFETENAISTLQFSCLVYLSPLFLRSKVGAKSVGNKSFTDFA